MSAFDIKVKGVDNFFPDYMDLENTNCIKGIFVWLIIFCHKRSYGKNKNYKYLKIIGNLDKKLFLCFYFIQVLESVNLLKKKVIIMLKL